MPEEKRVSKWDKGPEGTQIPQPTSIGENHASSDKPVRVSRFDQGPAASSKWDRCPSKWDQRPSDNTLKTPVEVSANIATAESNGDTMRSGIQAAAEAAAKVNAMLLAKGVLKPAQPLIVNDSLLRAKPISGGAVTSEVDINHLTIACRNALTRGSTQEEVSRLSGASVSTRGRYVNKEEFQSNPVDGEKPLHLFVQGSTQDSVNKAVARIQEIIASHERQKEGRQSVGTSSNLRPTLGGANITPQPLMSLNPNPTGMAYVQEKLFIGLEHAPPSFDVKNRIQGVNGSYLTHIQNETGAKVILRGKGSGFIEPTSGREAFEPMYIYVQHPTTIGLQAAKLLASNLIETVRQEFSQFQQCLAALPPTVSPGTASLLAGLQHRPQAPGYANPYIAPYGCQPFNVSSLPAQTQPGLMSSGLPVLPSNQVAPHGNVDTNYWPLTCQPEQLSSLGHNSSVSSTASCPLSSTFTVCTSSPFTSLPQSVNLPLPTVGPFHPQSALNTCLPPPTSFLPPPSYFPNPPHNIMLPFQPPPMIPPSLPPTVFSAIPGIVPSSVPSTGAGAGVAAGSVTPIAQVPVPVPSVSNAAASVSSTKRRFKEEKEEDELPDHLLGYQHGLHHLRSTMGRSGDINTSKQSAPCQDNSLKSQSKSSDKDSRYSPTSDKGSRYSPTRSLSDDEKDVDEQSLMPPPLAPIVVQAPTSRSNILPVVTSSRSLDDTFAAPLAPVRLRLDKEKKPIKVMRNEPENKKFKGALISVAMSYTSDDDDDDLADTETN